MPFVVSGQSCMPLFLLKSEQNKTEQNRTEQNRTEQKRKEQNVTE